MLLVLSEDWKGEKIIISFYYVFIIPVNNLRLFSFVEIYSLFTSSLSRGELHASK